MKQIFTILGIAAAIFFTNGNTAQTTFLSGEYGIRVIAKSATPGQYEKVGFQACVEDENGNKIGELSVSNISLTKIVGQDYITHKALGTAPSSEVSGDYHIWDFNWTAPEGFDGEVTVYVASMFTNNNGAYTGDVHVTTNHTFNVSVGIEELNSFDFSVYPNPVAEQINMICKKPFGENTRISLIDLKGAEVVLFAGDMHQREYSNGIYTLNIQSKNGRSSQQIVIQ